MHYVLTKTKKYHDVATFHNKTPKVTTNKLATTDTRGVAKITTTSNLSNYQES